MVSPADERIGVFGPKKQAELLATGAEAGLLGASETGEGALPGWVPGDGPGGEQRVGHVGIVDGEGSEVGDEPGLNVLLLKERLELELGLIREGARLLAFAALLVCFSIAFFQSTQPTNRAESRYYIAKQLQTDALNEAIGPQSVFRAIMDVASNTREMVPTSSHYISEPLGKVMVGAVQQFPSGPLTLAASRHPQLLLAWTMTVSLAIDKGTNLMPKKRLIARSYPSGDISGGSCWAWYYVGCNSYILEYGRNNVDNKYPEIAFTAEAWQCEGGRHSIRMVALKVNTTHAALRFKDDIVQAKSLETGTLPSGCNSATVEVGDYGLLLGNLQYYPKYLTDTELLEVEQNGQTLQDMASGAAQQNPGSFDTENTAESHVKTQRLVEEYGQSNLEITKLTGTLAYLGSLVDQESESDSEGSIADSSLAADESTGATFIPTPTPQGGAPSDLNWPELQLGADEAVGDFWRIIGKEGKQSGGDVSKAAEEALEDAFNSMYRARNWSFTLSWWSKADGKPYVSEFAMFQKGAGGADDMYRLEVAQIGWDDVDGNTREFWTARFNNAPFCSSIADEPCMSSPNVFCQLPEGGAYNGIWRHNAISFVHDVNGTGRSEMSLMLDGRYVCAFSFESSMEMVPQNTPDLKVQFMKPETEPGIINVPVFVADVRLFPQAQTARQVKHLSQEAELKECLDLEETSDRTEWLTEFGQSCAELRLLSSGEGASQAPAACRVMQAQKNCPVSCMDELQPLCNDGSPPILNRNSMLDLTRGSIAIIYILGTDQQLTRNRAPEDWSLSIIALSRLLETHDWQDATSSGQWNSAFDDIRRAELGLIFPSQDALVKIEQSMSLGQSATGIWLVNKSEAADGASCLGMDLDNEIAETDTTISASSVHKLITDICTTEVQTWTLLDGAMGRQDPESPGRDAKTVTGAMGWADADFPEGLLALGESFTLYFWAKSNNMDAAQIIPSVSGMDFDNNICFAIRGTTAWLQKHELVKHFIEYMKMQEESAPLPSQGADQLPTDQAKPEQSEDGSDSSEGQPGGPQGDGGGSDTSGRWSGGRLKLQAPESSKEDFIPDQWLFFAVSVDMPGRTARFAVNGHVVEEQIPEGDWGCNSLQVLLNGEDIDWSPVRISQLPMTKGSLQRLYLSSRVSFDEYLSGEDRSRFERLQLTELSIMPFNTKTVALAPPVIMQRRIDAMETSDSSCQGSIIESYNQRVESVLDKKCSEPYDCADGESRKNAYVRCMPENGNSPQSFFGGQRIQDSAGNIKFASFAWTLQSEVIVRDGEELRPAVDYITSETTEVQLIIPFYTPLSQIATVMISTFDLRSTKAKVNTQFLQLAVLTWPELVANLCWTCAAILFATLSIAMTLRAAAQEVKDYVLHDLRWLRRLYRRLMSSFSPIRSMRERRKYSSNTTQPDLFDVVLNLGMIALMIAYIVNQFNNFWISSTNLSDIAKTDWSNLTDSSPEGVDKIEGFLKDLQQAMEAVQAEERILNAAFWMLWLCCVRLIIFMTIHPRISAIARTFLSVGTELLNFMLSFGIIFTFLAYMAHMRFGALYDEFATFRGSLIMQFALLIGDASPEAYTDDSLLCIYVVGFAFICTLSLLNFLLAIVVNGYTQVTERVLENKVAQSVLTDFIGIPFDLAMWTRHRLPTRLDILKRLQRVYPDIFDEESELVVVAISRQRFAQVMADVPEVQTSKSMFVKEIDSSVSNIVFGHYLKYEVLHVFPDDPYQVDPDCDLSERMRQTQTMAREMKSHRYSRFDSASFKNPTPFRRRIDDS